MADNDEGARTVILGRELYWECRRPARDGEKARYLVGLVNYSVFERLKIHSRGAGTRKVHKLNESFSRYMTAALKGAAASVCVYKIL